MSEKMINDALEKSIGYYYQCYIALLDCFEMKEEDILLIETEGDVSVISINGTSFQKEVKHHKSNENLNDRNIEFWKSLYNWVHEYEKIEKYDCLIFSTTADISPKSIFCKWNEKNLIDRINNLKSVGASLKSFNDGSNKNFAYYFERIFSDSLDSTIIEKIIDKVKIAHLKPKLPDIKNDFQKYLTFIPDNKIIHMVNDLIGFLIDQIKEENGKYCWSISKQKFRKAVSEKAFFYNHSITSIPLTYKDSKVPNEDYTVYSTFDFVTKIKEIDLATEVDEAILCYWKAQQTIINYFEDDIALVEPLTVYKDTIENILKNTKKRFELGFFDNECKKKYESQKFFYDMMGYNLINIGAMTNHPFFQKGVIHSIANDTQFRWKLGDNDEI